MSDQHDLPEDPLDLDAIDREIRINELTEQVKDLGAGESYVSENCPPELHEQFLSGIVAFESAPLGSQFQRLTEAGVELPPPDSLDDGALHAKLWEVINALAAWDVYLQRTDHLSDRALYQDLWGDLLRDQVALMPPGSGWRNYIDVIGSGSQEDIEISLRYYDTEEDRRHWAKEFPSDVIPPHEDPPFDRDRHLPQPPEEVRGPGEDEDDDE